MHLLFCGAVRIGRPNFLDVFGSMPCGLVLALRRKLLHELPGRPLHSVLWPELVHGVLRCRSVRRLEHQVIVILVLWCVQRRLLLQGGVHVADPIRLRLWGRLLSSRLGCAAGCLAWVLLGWRRFHNAHLSSCVPQRTRQVLLGREHLDVQRWTLRLVCRAAIVSLRRCMLARFLLPSWVHFQVPK